MRKIILTFILVLASGFVLYCSYVCVKNINTIGSESEVKGKEMSSDEYIYKEDLLHLGYNLNDIEVIQNKISNVDVKEYFLKEKYDNISSYINALNFIPKNISRYVAYHNRNQNMTYDNISNRKGGKRQWLMQMMAQTVYQMFFPQQERLTRTEV